MSSPPPPSTDAPNPPAISYAGLLPWGNLQVWSDASALPELREQRCPGLSDDSRSVADGGLFLARGPWTAQSKDFVSMAAQAGARVVWLPADAEPSFKTWRDQPGFEHVVFVASPRVDQTLAGQLADRFYAYPARQLRLVGVTGTNGKTTVAMLTQHLLRATGLRVGLLGTVWTDVGHADGPTPAELTTPGAIELRRHLAAMVRHRCDAVVMEVSSHALDQGRTAGLPFDAAVFTNLSQDHLDYHQSMDAYAAAKAKLFEQLKPDGVAIVNGDDEASDAMIASVDRDRVHRTHLVSAPHEPTAAMTTWAKPQALDASGTTATLTGAWGQASARLPLVGEHNLQNVLQATCAAHALAPQSADTLTQHLTTCPPVPGRLEPVRRLDGQGPNVLVDYAHTPDALERVSETLAQLTHGGDGEARLLVVFGCGGDRDRRKRPLMTAAALKHADLAILTSDNPRSEDPEQICADAQADVGPTDRARLRVIVDRAQAIRDTIAEACAADTVLIAGKGHEDYQVLAAEPGVFGQATRKIHFDDREHAADALAEWQPPAEDH